MHNYGMTANRRIFLNIVATYGLDEFVKVFAAGYGDVNVFAMV